MDFIAILFGVIVAAVIIWTAIVLWRHYAAAGRPVRLPRMLARLGLSVEGIADSELAEHLPTAARQCSICGSAAECDHLLASEADLDRPPDFCPNASYIRLAKRTTRTG